MTFNGILNVKIADVLRQTYGFDLWTRHGHFEVCSSCGLL